MLGEVIATLRGMLVRGAVHRVADGGEVQQADVETHEGVLRSTVEVVQPFGFASHPPEGAVALVFALGGDQGDMVALLTAPGARLGNLAPGEAALYGADGSRVHVKAGGVIEVLAASKVVVRAPAVEIEAPDGVSITGPARITGEVQITGNLRVTGTITATGTVHGANI